MQVFDYILSVGGNFSVQVNGMSDAAGIFSANVKGVESVLGNLAKKLTVLDLVADSVGKMNEAVNSFSSAGIALDSQMHDLSAVAGVTSEGLKQIEGYARSSARAFGSDAGTVVEGYKLLLSQLTPELGKCPEALKAMGDAIQTTRKLMGGDGTAAAEVLTTAMNQYGVSLDDPMEASRKMAEMMNTMAAAG